MSFDADLLAFIAEAQTAQKALASVMSHNFEAVQTLSQKLADFEATQKWVQKWASELGATQDWAEKWASESEAMRKWVGERAALIPSGSDPVVHISPRQHVRMPSLAIEASNKRTIVRPEVKRKIGF